MEKTTGFALKEAVEMGRRSANTAFYQVELREKIAQEIEEARKPYLNLCNDKGSEDYSFYQGICNGMNFAMVIARKTNDSN
jgi:hypothetical protein